MLVRNLKILSKGTDKEVARPERNTSPSKDLDGEKEENEKTVPEDAVLPFVKLDQD